MTLKVFPVPLLTPASPQTWIDGGVIAGGESLAGWGQSAAFGAGGFRRARLEGIELHDLDAVMCARAWARHLAQGTQSVLVPLWSLVSAPRPMVGGRLALPGQPAPLAQDDWFGWEPSFGQRLMSLTVRDAAELNDTTVWLTGETYARIRGGQLFSVEHETWGHRAYDIVELVDRDGDDHQVRITPPWREDTEAALAAEFDIPLCEMRLDPARADECEPKADIRGVAPPVTFNFIEGPKPEPE